MKKLFVMVLFIFSIGYGGPAFALDQVNDLETTQADNVSAEKISDVFPDPLLAQYIVEQFKIQSPSQYANLTVDSNFEELAASDYSLNYLTNENLKFSDITGIDKLKISSYVILSDISKDQFPLLVSSLKNGKNQSDYLTLGFSNSELTNEDLTTIKNLIAEKNSAYLILDDNCITDFSILNEVTDKISGISMDNQKIPIYMEPIKVINGILKIDADNIPFILRTPDSYPWGYSYLFRLTSPDGKIAAFSQSVSWDGITDLSGEKEYTFEQTGDSGQKVSQRVIVPFTSVTSDSSTPEPTTPEPTTPEPTTPEPTTPEPTTPEPTTPEPTTPEPTTPEPTTPEPTTPEPTTLKRSKSVKSLPTTGSDNSWMMFSVGIIIMAGASVLFMVIKKKLV